MVCGLLMVAGVARAELKIAGIPEAQVDTLLAFISVDDLACDAPRWWVRRNFQQMVTEARLALETLGYYQARFQTDLGRDEACWHATLEVERGRRTRIGTVELAVTGGLEVEIEMREFLASDPLPSGDGFRHALYEGAKERLLEVAEDLGYFDAAFELAEVRVDLETNRADIRLLLASGPRYRIGAIEVEQDELDPALFSRLLKFEPGRPFDAHDLASTYSNLLASQYFDRVLVTPDIDGRADGQVDIRISASSASRRTLLFGAGFATDSGPRARADVQYRRLNDRGHRGSVRTLVSGVAGELKGEYRIPYGDPVKEWLFAEAGTTYEDNDTYTNRLWTVVLGRTHRRFTDWVETNYLNYQMEDFSIAGEEGQSELLLMGTSWSRKRAGEGPRPMSGYSVSLDLRGALDALASTSDVLQVIGRARHIQPLGSRLRLLSRASIGWTWQEAFSDLPPSIRFFAGGDNSVRGYDYESIGPEVAGEVVGGRRLVTGSLELDIPVREKWSVALFGDMGSAYDDSPDFQRSLGVGVRWYSPLGPLRLDLAHPLDDPHRSVRLHIALGPDL